VAELPRDLEAEAAEWPCRWCGHPDWEHDIPGVGASGSALAPCGVDGCRCEDYDEDDDVEDPADG
jgi:hypothetical protein